MSQRSRDKPLTIRLLGSFSVSVGDRVIEDAAWQRRGARQLVKHLALNPLHRLHREVLAESLWPDSPPAKSFNNLNKMLFMARRALEPGLKQGADSSFLHRDGETIELSSKGGLEVDIEVFEASAMQALKQASSAPLRRSAGMYTQDLLADEPYDDSIAGQRQRLARLHQQVLLKLADAADNEGRTDESIDSLQQLLTADPHNEAYHRKLIRIYAASDQRSLAMEQYQICRTLLQQEFAEQPDAETEQLMQRIASAGRDTGSVPARPATTESASLPLADDANVLAVLSLQNSSTADEADYLCDGVADNLTVSLSRLPAQRVLARSALRHYKPQSLDPFRLRRELSVGRVVCGRLALRNERIRVWIEVLDTRDGILLWTQHYERDIRSIVELQNQIAEDVLSWFRSALKLENHPGIPDLKTENARAYQDYLKGRYYWNKRNDEALQQARRFFQSAINRDPLYALAYTGLADTYNVMSLYSTLSPHETMPKARAAARHALAIDGQLAEAHTSLAYCLVSYDWLWYEAEEAFKRALSINPDYATARQWYHKLLVALGRFDEARAQIDQARLLDPLSAIISTEQAWGLYYARQYESASALLKKTLQDDPQFSLARCLLGLAQIQTVDLDQAIGNLLQAGDNGRKTFTMQLGALGYAYARNADTAQALQVLKTLDNLDGDNGGAAHARAQIYTGLKKPDSAIDNLESTFAARFDRLIFLPAEPLFQPLHSLPRMRAMLRQLDLVPLPG